MEKEKLISISERDWHYKLIKFVWNINPKMFKNLCPYFWLTIASIICVPFVLLWVGIKTLFIALGNAILWLADLIYDKFLYGLYLDSLTDAELYYMAHANESNKGDDFAKFKTLLTKPCDTLEKALKRRKLTLEAVEKFKDAFDKEVDKLTKLREETKKRQDQKYYKQQHKKVSQKERERKIKERMYNIVDYTKNFFVGLFLLGIAAVGYLLTTCITQVLCFITQITITWAEFLHVLTVLGCVIGGTVIVIAIVFACMYLYDLWQNDELTGWKLWICYPVIWLCKGCKYLAVNIFANIICETIILGIISGFVEGFREFGGIFADYFDASYSDYCPGINWEEEK